jgi:hypothetical protein
MSLWFAGLSKNAGLRRPVWVHYRKSALVTAMSAFPPIATILRTSREVRFVPISDIDHG